MDTSDSKNASDKKKPKAETTRLPLVSSENKYGTTRRSQTREVSSRGRSPSPSPAPVSKRFPSPNASTRTSNSTLPVPKRAVSTERKRPCIPPPTPVHDTTLGSRKNPESSSLWPSTTRSVDASAPIGKREKQQPVSLSRSSTPERKNLSADVAENSTHSSRWPGRAAVAPSAVKASNNSKTDKMTKTTPSLFNFRTAVAPSSCTRRLSLDGTSKPQQKSSTDLLKLISREEMFSGSSVDNDDDFDAATVRRQSLPGSGAHGISPSVSKRVSPSRGSSPATIRQSSPSRQPQNSSSVLGFTSDINEKITKTNPSLFNFRTAVAPSSCTRRLSLDGTSKPQQKSSTDLLKLISHEEMFSGSSVDNDDEFDATTVRRQSLPGSGAHGMSPSVSGRVSPATIRQSSPSRQPQNSAFVPGFTPDINEKKTKTTPSLFNFRTAVAPSSCTRRLSLDGTSKPLLKSSTDLLKPISREEMFNGSSVDNDNDDFDAATTRRQSLPSSGAHGTSPLVSRRVSPATIRQSSPSRQPQNSSSVLGFTSDINEKKTKTTPSLFNFRTAVAPSSCTRRLSLDGASKPLLKSSTDLLKLISREEMFNGSSVDNDDDDDDDFDAATARRQSLPGSGAHGMSPSVSRRVSPSRGRSVTPCCSRGASPTRIIRPSSPSRQPQNSTFVPGFIADVKKGKKVENNAEDAHQLRLLYNRHLQWRYANARNIDALHSQKAKAEKIFYSVWRIILDLWDMVTEKRSDLKQLRLKLKIYSILDNQMNYLNKWASIERCHASSLTCIIEDLQSSTILVPVTGGATVDIKTVKSAVCAAVDVMMEIGSSLCSIIPLVEGTNSLASKLADVAAHERAMLDECESLLRSTAALQVEEDSLRTQLLLIKQNPSVYG
ncbi:hypothetical protein ABFS83_10G129600 [Erythranthe nasuta]